MSSDEEEYSEIATPDLINYDDKKLVNDKYGSISLCKFPRKIIFVAVGLRKIVVNKIRRNHSSVCL